MSDAPTPGDVETTLAVIEWYLSLDGRTNEAESEVSTAQNFFEFVLDDDHIRQEILAEPYERPTGSDPPIATIQWEQTCKMCEETMRWKHELMQGVDFDPHIKERCEHCNHRFVDRNGYQLIYWVSDIEL